MITYKRKAGGRPTLVQRKLLNDVNAMIRELPKAEQKKWTLTVNNDADLQKAYASLSAGESKFTLTGNNDESLKPTVEKKPEPTPVQKPVEQPTQEIKEEVIEPKIQEPMSKENDFSVPDSFDFDPLTGPTIERASNRVEIDMTAEPIPEPIFVGNGQSPQNPNPSSGPTPHNPPPTQPSSPNVEYPSDGNGPSMDNVTNPAMNDLDDKQKKIAATQLVDAVLSGYEMLHQFGVKVAQTDETKIAEKIMSGEIDNDMSFPMDDEEVTPLEFVQIMNKQAEQAIAYDPEFGKKVKPAMERVFAKKGWGMTDEQFLMVAFGQDIAMKGMLIYALKKQQSSMIKMFVDMKSTAQMQQTAQEHNMQSVKPDTIIKDEAPIEKQAPITAEDVEDELAEVTE